MAHTANVPAQGILSSIATRIGAAFEQFVLVIEEARRLRAEAVRHFPSTAE